MNLGIHQRLDEEGELLLESTRGFRGFGCRGLGVFNHLGIAQLPPLSIDDVLWGSPSNGISKMKHATQSIKTGIKPKTLQIRI